MGWLARLLGAASPSGLRLGQPCREVDGAAGFSELFEALHGWVPEGAILYFEGGSPDAQIEDFMTEHSIPERVHIAPGTIWPKPRVFHVLATGETLSELAKIMECHAAPELAIHFHVYRDDSVLLEWHDAFSQPMLLSRRISEDQVKALADRLGTLYRMDHSDPTSAGEVPR